MTSGEMGMLDRAKELYDHFKPNMPFEDFALIYAQARLDERRTQCGILTDRRILH